ncbi:hypothetical protein B0H14DRAFT_2976828 [Mycena olivaceomarginata]|nr:hypothetical protein B0H14DRAFT_2976828 [Mycena olivaceomarginata]
MSAPRPRDVSHSALLQTPMYPAGDAESQCASSSNTNTSCYPASLTAFVQGQNASFICISQYDSAVYEYRNPASGAGVLQVPVNDSWWGAKGAIWVGNVSYPFLWTIWGVDEQDTFTIGRQPMFAAIRDITGSVTSPLAFYYHWRRFPFGWLVQSHGDHRGRGVLRMGVVLLISVFFLIRRRRLARTPPPNYIPDPILNLGVYEKQPLRTVSSKRALDLEMRTAHERLLALQHELLAQPQPGSDIPAGSQNENAELRARIQLLTEEAPPAYSIQEG